MVMVTKNILIVLILAVLGSCSKPKLSSLVKDDSFDYRRLRLGYLLVSLPVNTEEAKSTEFASFGSSDQRLLTAHTLQVIQNNNENINVKPIYAHKKYKETVKKELQKFSKDGVPNIDNLASTFMSFPDPYRYLFIVRPMKEKTWQDQRVYTRTKKKQVKKGDKKITIKENYRHKDLISYRKVDLNGIVIDLKFKAIVWDGLSSKTLSNVNSMKKKIGQRINVSDIVFANDKHPAYPDLLSATKAAINDLAINLPSEDDD